MNAFGNFLSARQHLPLFKWEHYFPVYETHLSRFINTDVTLFEIGVLGGGSLQMWKQFLGPRANIVGLEIDPNCKNFEDRSISVEIGDQGSEQFLSDVVMKHGLPDIVIDDGSHINSDIMKTLLFFQDKMPKNASYIIEDCHALFHEAWEGNPDAQGTLFDWVREQFSVMHQHYLVQEEKPLVETIGITGFHIYDSIIALDFGKRKSFKAFQIASRNISEITKELDPQDFVK